MRFTRLRLNGFKSFVDPTELVIHQGLTGVVGPNGCGKSNLLEALRWVMGENRASAMRGDGMDDVIFNGAASRPARHFAEVVLTLDNALRTAPPGFNDHDVIDVARRITRDAGSAYKSNGKDVRARDVQMLFADASTGAHSPALVRQGQISELINARPKSRRRVLEEAAGISGLYQRRHEAELKLQATEANLTRVDDVLEALAQQLSVLTRQARQAERYVELSTALRRVEGQLLYRLWREAGEAATASQAQLAEALVLASRAASGARDAAAAREAAEAELPALREAEVVASAILQRIAVQKEALADEETRATANITALAAREMQLLADIAREEDLNRDAGETIGKLEWELSQLASAEDGHEARLADATRRAEDAARVLMDAEGALDRLTEDTARLSARHVAAQRLAEENRLARDRAATGAQEAEASAQAAQEALDTAMSAERAAETDFAAATDRLARTEAAVAEAETARADTAAREALARGARSAAEGETQALRAEMQALARLVEREAQIGAQVLDVLEVEPGIETALAAALADDLRAPVVEAAGKTGWRSLAPYDAPPALPEGSAPLSTLVRGATVLDRRLSQIGLVARDAGPALQARLLPGQRLVSREGDLWRWDGFQAGADAAKSTAALRLQQLNRLTALKGELSQAEARATGAGQAHEALLARLGDLTEADRLAREARRAADQHLAEASRAQSRLAAEKSMADGKRAAALDAAARLAAEARDAAGRLAEAEATLKGLDDLDGARGAVEAAKLGVEAARVTMLSHRASQDDLRRDGEARTRRRQTITIDLSGWRLRLETASGRRAELEARLTETRGSRAAADAVPADIAARSAAMAEAWDSAEARRRLAADALHRAEAGLRAAQEVERTAERAAGDAREAQARAEVRRDATEEALAQTVQRIAQDAETTPEALAADLQGDAEPLADAAELEIEAGRLRRQREALGAVNLRAAEDARAVETEYDTLAREKSDLEDAVQKLRAGIAGLNREGRERLLTAFEEVNRNFAALFTHLFGGGEARLVLVESDDPLEAGLEIMCQPPGKRLATLSLLSGGEQTLTALALIFAVFLANPAPICVLDEVDAPLDDANVTRFCDLLDEMTRRTETRFLIITHHAVTMARMDRLFGVTMVEQGVSQLVSVDLKRAESLVA